MIEIPFERLKKILVDDAIITADKFEELANDARRLGQGPASILISKNIMTDEYYMNLLSRFYKVPITTLEIGTTDDEALRLLTEDFARDKHVVIFKKELDGTLDVAMEDPSDLTTIEYLETKFQARIKPFLVSTTNLARIFAFYGKEQVEGFRKIIQENIQASLQLSGKKDVEAAVQVPIIAITDNIISYAVSLRASDIHIEALEAEILVRYRIDGLLREIIRIQKEIHPAIVARFKILSGMKLDEHTNPQDGRFHYKIGSDYVDIRVSILPTMYGEKVELRLLTGAGQILSFEELGMSPEIIKGITENVTKSYGMVLVTGPTGSGKSTTLYSILHTINRPEVNIITVEDPIEYDIKYVNQTQINETAGITFAAALRAILRQDPNIIMVGEIRDEETAEISVHAALTGHMLLSSLHTNDAPTAIPRLVDMHVAPFLMAAVLNTVLAQRLVRRICYDCLYSYPTPLEIKKLIETQIAASGLPADTPIPKTLFKGKGCPSCGHSGYRGRMGIYELLNINENLRSAIVDPSFSLEKLRTLAQANGMKSMFEDGLLKAGQGKTTIDEVMRVIRE
jgi:type IV pilus assembly protein PilB